VVRENPLLASSARQGWWGTCASDARRYKGLTGLVAVECR
jgi:hypothetical protein